MPNSPSTASVDANIQIAARQRSYFPNGAAFLYSWFYEQVRNRGPWDYKQISRGYEDFGNFNYGATGTACGFSEMILLRAAGFAQSRAGTSNPELGTWYGAAPYGDDHNDQYWIKEGIRYAQSQGHHAD
jgi:hypothetical protein